MDPQQQQDQTADSDPFLNPVWAALHTTHRHFAIHAPGVVKYPADVAPFAALINHDEASLRHLHSITDPGEGVSLIGDKPEAVEGFEHVQSLPGLQMIYPPGKQPPRREPDRSIEIELLSDADAPALVALTDLAFPGYFRKRTCEMGTYYGVYEGDTLIAMAGERIAFNQCREVSGVVTHPAHTGKGLAATLICKVVQDHFESGLHSFLHVAAQNERAIALYQRLGFILHREVTFHRIRRID